MSQHLNSKASALTQSCGPWSVFPAPAETRVLSARSSAEGQACLEDYGVTGATGERELEEESKRQQQQSRKPPANTHGADSLPRGGDRRGGAGPASRAAGKTRREAGKWKVLPHPRQRQGGRPARPHNEPEVFVPGKRQTPGPPAGFLHAFSTRVVTEGRALSATLRSPPNVPESITTVRGERASPARGAVSREPARRPQDPTLRGHLWPRTLGSGMAAEGLGAARPKCRVSPETHARSVLSTTENMSVKKQTNTPSGNLHFTLILSLVRMPTTYETRTKVRRQ